MADVNREELAEKLFAEAEYRACRPADYDAETTQLLLNCVAALRSPAPGTAEGWKQAIHACLVVVRKYRDEAIEDQKLADKKDEIVFQRPALVAAVLEAQIQAMLSAAPASPSQQDRGDELTRMAIEFCEGAFKDFGIPADRLRTVYAPLIRELLEHAYQLATPAPFPMVTEEEYITALRSISQLLSYGTNTTRHIEAKNIADALPHSRANPEKQK